jgi:hypothetical protein
MVAVVALAGLAFAGGGIVAAYRAATGKFLAQR